MSQIKFTDLILYEDDNLVVVDKPANISTLDDRNDPINMLKLAHNYLDDLQICHRLDKETSGALVIAKNPDSYRHMALQFEQRKVKKIYHAVVEGNHDFIEMEVNEPILIANRGRVKIHGMGKPSITRVKTITQFKRYTLVECQPLTGRMHQIRIHLSHLQAPISGDNKYGGSSLYLSSIKRNYQLKKYQTEIPLIKRMALHAAKIKFQSLDDQLLEVEAPYPKDFKVLLKQLDLNR
ncbi:MAG: RluA family pseudouridine synthase [Bacteroidetes bacterium]|nr:RluA family pseudouridine synthase [Bacteroidota bacterium]